MAINKFKFKRSDDTEVNVDIDVNSYPKLPYTMSVTNIAGITKQIQFKYCGGTYNPSITQPGLCGVFETPYIELIPVPTVTYDISSNSPIMIYDANYNTQYCLEPGHSYHISAFQPGDTIKPYVITSANDSVKIDIY